MKKVTAKEALLRLTTLCAQSEHCAYEMEEKMRRWEMTDTEIATVMEQLVKQKFVDDKRYARAFAKDKLKYNKWGRRKIDQAMWAKRIDEDTRHAVLDDISDDDYLSVLRPLLKSKRRSVKADNEYELNNKLARFALSRGFTFDLVRQCLGEVDDCLDDEPCE